MCVACQAFWVNVTGFHAGMAACGMVAVCAAGVGVSMAAAVVGLPASSVVAGIMLPDRIACCAALVLAVSACVPAIVFETFWNFVLPDSSHRCSEPLDDCRIRNFFVARTTMPRWMANIFPLWLAWLNWRAWVSRESCA